MIKTPLSTVIGGAFWTPEATVIGGGALNFEKLVAKLFSNNEQGFFYDPNDLSTMFQDAAGTAPVTAVGQPLGLVLDKSKGLMLGAELWDDSKVFFDGESSRISNNEYRILSTSGAYSGMSLFGTEDLRQYFVLVEFTVSQLTAGRVGIENITQSSYGIGTHKVVTRCSSLRFTFKRTGVTDAVVKDISVKILKGNHAYQTTSAARPILQNTPRRIDFDAIDDKLITTLPAQLTGCTVIRSVPNVGTQILTGQTIPATYEDNTDHCGLIVINRALTPSETSVITSEFNKRAGV